MEALCDKSREITYLFIFAAERLLKIFSEGSY